MPELPPERQSKKNDFSSSFEHPRNHFAPPSPPPPPAGDGTSANIPPKEAAAVSADKRPEHREGLTNWTPWVVGACLAGGRSCFSETRKREVPRRWRQPPLTPRLSSLPGAKSLKTRALLYGMSNHDDSSNRREDDRERALP